MTTTLKSKGGKEEEKWKKKKRARQRERVGVSGGGIEMNDEQCTKEPEEESWDGLDRGCILKVSEQ